jgi:hypothetical protein
MRCGARHLGTAVVPQQETWGQLPALATSIEAFAALGDRAGSAATPLMQPGTYLEPVELRGLGLVRENRALVDQAAARFDALGFQWHAATTRPLLP